MMKLRDRESSFLNFVLGVDYQHFYPEILMCDKSGTDQCYRWRELILEVMGDEITLLRMLTAMKRDSTIIAFL